MKRRSLQKINGALATFFLIGALLSACQSKPPLLTPVMPSPIGATILPSQVATQLAQQATPTPKPSATPWQVASSTPSPAPTRQLLGNTNPLTGQTVDQSTLLRQRPVLVKIANWPEDLRPADGLNQASMVFEYFIGAQTNQLLALFYGNDFEHVGPLDSGKVIDARITEHYQGNLAVASADPILEDVFENFLKDRNARRGYIPCPGICTETVAQGGLTFADTAAIREILSRDLTENPTPLLFGLSFSETAPPSQDAATRFSHLYADFSVMDWRYDEKAENYELWQDKRLEPKKYTLTRSEDQSSGEPITFDNIVFLFTDYQNYRDLFFDINFMDGNLNQPGILLRNGKLYPIHWGAKDYTSPILFFDLQGNSIPLKPGKTWVTLTSLDSKLEQVDPSEWDLTFIVK